MRFEELTSGEPIAARVGDAVVEFSSQRHAIFGDENSALKFRGVVFAEKVEAFGQRVPVPPFTREAVHEVAAKALPAEFQIAKRGRSEEVSGEGVVVIEPEVIEHTVALGLRESLQEVAEGLGDGMFGRQEV